jgi:hypothetical protein
MAAIGETGYTAIRQMFFWKTIVGNIDALLLVHPKKKILPLVPPPSA